MLGEESDVHDNRIFVEERNRRSDRRQVKMDFWFCTRNGFVEQIPLFMPDIFGVSQNPQLFRSPRYLRYFKSNDAMLNIM